MAGFHIPDDPDRVQKNVQLAAHYFLLSLYDGSGDLKCMHLCQFLHPGDKETVRESVFSLIVRLIFFGR